MSLLHPQYHDQIKTLIKATKKLIQDCSLENGAIVAADSTQNNYPANAKNYFYVWPRDAAFACMAADVLDVKEVQENFFSWCLNRAEGFHDQNEGLFFEKYYPNGLKAQTHFQPDQNGTVLTALWHYHHYHSAEVIEFSELVDRAANGMCRVWKTNSFSVVTNDLWEERLCFPDLCENFSYSLAACIKGLRCASALIPHKKWMETADEMQRRLDEHFRNYFIRSYGEIPDTRIDASILGLVYPFELYDANDPRIIATIQEIENRLITGGGIHRYEHDDYDGWMYETEHRKKGAGAWPLLNFWMSIYYAIKGDAVKAFEYYKWVLDKIKDGKDIPEQIFENNRQISVSPLLWSHAMFVLATDHLKRHIGLDVIRDESSGRETA